MAVEIQEPTDLPSGSITDETASRYEILVYEKAQDNAGIKKIGIAPWKDYLNFNSHKVKNVANYLGMPSGYPWESDADVPYGPPYAEEHMTLTEQVNTLQSKLGIDTSPATFNPLYPRFEQVEKDVEGIGEPATGGLMQRMTSAEQDIQSLSEEIGSGSGGSGTLTARINTLEDTVGDSTSGLVKDVTDINIEIGDDSTANSIKGRIKVNEDNITANTTNIGNLQTTVGDNNGGLVKDVTTLQSVVGDDNSGLVKDVHDLKSKVYVYCGNITDVDDASATTAILVDGKFVSLNSITNGSVYNINPIGVDTISMTINGILYKFSKGTNVAWVKRESESGYFDELGATIDITEINKLKTDVSTLQSYFKTTIVDSSWTSADIPDGIYQFSCVLGSAASGWNISTFILAFTSGQSYTQVPVDISSNFDTYWEFDTDFHLKPKGIGSGTRNLSIHKIGEI